jgi:hypothetical protein
VRMSCGLRLATAMQPVFDLIASGNGCQSFGGGSPFTQIRPAPRAVSLPANRYCPSSATELFSMCSRIPGTIEPVRS